MRIPPSVHVVLSPSRIAGTGIGLLAAATLVLDLALPLHPLMQFAAVAAVVVWAAW